MGITRLVLLALLAAAAWWVWQKIRLLPPAGRKDPGINDSSPMVACAHCQLHLPQQDALLQQQSWYCSKEHAQAGPKHHAP